MPSTLRRFSGPPLLPPDSRSSTLPCCPTARFSSVQFRSVQRSTAVACLVDGCDVCAASPAISNHTVTSHISTAASGSRKSHLIPLPMAAHQSKSPPLARHAPSFLAGPKAQPACITAPPPSAPSAAPTPAPLPLGALPDQPLLLFPSKPWFRYCFFIHRAPSSPPPDGRHASRF